MLTFEMLVHVPTRSLAVCAIAGPGKATPAMSAAVVSRIILFIGSLSVLLRATRDRDDGPLACAPSPKSYPTAHDRRFDFQLTRGARTQACTKSPYLARRNT